MPNKGDTKTMNGHKYVWTGRYWTACNDFGVTISASKHSRYSVPGMLKGFHHWVDRNKYNRKQAARKARRDEKKIIEQEVSQ